MYISNKNKTQKTEVRVSLFIQNVAYCTNSKLQNSKEMTYQFHILEYHMAFFSGARDDMDRRLIQHLIYGKGHYLYRGYSILLRTRENITEFCLTSEINMIFNKNNFAFSIYYIFRRSL